MVADVRRYPEFLPWCVGARILSRERAGTDRGPHHRLQDVPRDLPQPGAAGPARHVHVRYLDGPFRYLNNTLAVPARPGGTEVDFFVDFEFRSRLLQAVIGTVFNEAVRLMVRAFERRAMAMHGRLPAAAAGAPATSP
jgi:coenzyme Q-binding protein COQ10